MLDRRWFLGLGLALAGILVATHPAGAGFLDASWTAPTTNTDGSPLTDLASYRVYYGSATGSCPGSIFFEVASPTSSPAPNTTMSFRLVGLAPGTRYYVSVTAVDLSGNESGCSLNASGTAHTDSNTNSTTPGTLTSPPPGSQLGGGTVSFGWSSGTGATEYWLEAGTTGVGSTNLYSQSQGLSLSGTVSGLPTNGSTVYVRLWTRLSGTWQFNDYTYRAASQNKATLTNPPPGSPLGGATVSFGWSAGTGATEYWLEVGTTGTGSTNLYSQSQGLRLSGTVSGLPTNGGTVYVRLWTRLGDQLLGSQTWQFNDYTYTTR